MIILSVNAGSSSLKFTGFEMPSEDVLISGVFERIGIDNSFYTIKVNGEKIKKEVELPNHKVAFEILIKELMDNKIVDSLDEIKGVGHRIVQGGAYFDKTEVATEDVIAKIDELATLAPLHNPPAIVGIRAAMEVMPNAMQTVVFDTAFHQTMAPVEYMYAVPYSWYTEYGIRKYGAHGTSHKYVALRMNEILGRNDTKLITCHIGNGASISAVKDGKCFDTSMGLTPLEGVPMGTRSGDLDPAVVEFITNLEGCTVSETLTMLNKKSGVLAVSGVSSDFRDLDNAVEEGNERAKLALDMFNYAVKKYIGSYAAAMGGVDGIVFTAGVGENSASVREACCEGLEYMGVKIDKEANNCRGKLQKISTEDSKVQVYVIPTNEELVIARDAKAIVEG